MTTFRFEFLGGALLFGVLCFLFARNVQRGRMTGEIYNRSILLRRVESPINFWITMVFYSIATIFTATGVLFCVGMAVSPDAVTGLL